MSAVLAIYDGLLEDVATLRHDLSLLRQESASEFKLVRQEAVTGLESVRHEVALLRQDLAAADVRQLVKLGLLMAGLIAVAGTLLGILR